jgi:glycosyltransferase involved in cell wall biosynthesis
MTALAVSVICPVFNSRPDELRAAVASVLGQDRAGVCELLLVDDCSTDPGTLQAVADLAASDARVVALRAAANGGPARARNLGLERATRPWVGFLDSDDLWLERLEQAALVLESHPETGWIAGDTVVLDRSGAMTPAPRLGCVASGALCATPVLTRSIILDGMHLGTSLIRRDRIGVLRFDPAVLYGEDILFLVRLSLDTAMRAVAAPWYVSRRQHGSMMWSAGRLSDRFASGPLAGFRDPALRGFRREYRWALYAVFKDLAVNNLVNGRGWVGLRHALRAWAFDPREVGALVRYLGLVLSRGRPGLAERARAYSRCEQVLLDGAGRFREVV